MARPCSTGWEDHWRFSSLPSGHLQHPPHPQSHQDCRPHPPTHPSHSLFSLPPSGRIMPSLPAKSSRFKDCLFHQAASCWPHFCPCCSFTVYIAYCYVVVFTVFCFLFSLVRAASFLSSFCTAYAWSVKADYIPTKRCTSWGHVNASPWAVGFLRALPGWGHQWSPAPLPTCAQFQTRPERTCPNTARRDWNAMWKRLVVSVWGDVGGWYRVKEDRFFPKGNAEPRLSLRLWRPLSQTKQKIGLNEKLSLPPQSQHLQPAHGPEPFAATEAGVFLVS